MFCVYPEVNFNLDELAKDITTELCGKDTFHFALSAFKVNELSMLEFVSSLVIIVKNVVTVLKGKGAVCFGGI